MKLVKLEDYKLTIEPELLHINAFKKIWNRDRTKYKERALMELGYIYFLVDLRSDYKIIADEADRAKQIIEQEGLPENFKEDALIKEAKLVWISLNDTPSSLLLKDSLISVSNLGTFLRTMDLTKTDINGKPIYTVNTLTSALKQLPDIAKKIIETEKLVAKEIEENDHMRGQRTKKIFEDGF